MQEAFLFDAFMLYLDFGHEPREKALNRASTELTRLHVFSLCSYCIPMPWLQWRIMQTNGIPKRKQPGVTQPVTWSDGGRARGGIPTYKRNCKCMRTFLGNARRSWGQQSFVRMSQNCSKLLPPCRCLCMTIFNGINFPPGLSVLVWCLQLWRQRRRILSGPDRTYECGKSHHQASITTRRAPAH